MSASLNQIPGQVSTVVQRAQAQINQAVGSANNSIFRNFQQQASAAGTAAGSALSSNLRQRLDDFASRIPIVGSALAGLGGAALVGAAGIGAIVAGLAVAIKGTEEYHQALRGLEGTLQATGNKTGLTAQQMADFAEQLETTNATAAEGILGVEKTLAGLDGIAGTTFRRATKDAIDMASALGIDMTDAATKLGGAIQNLQQGNVEGLTRGFKFLGTATLENISYLAKHGQTAEAVELLLSRLESRVGGVGAKNAEGLSGAFFQLGDAIGDTTRHMTEATGIMGPLERGIRGVADAINSLSGPDTSTGEGLSQAIIAKTKEQITLQDVIAARGGYISAQDKARLKTLDDQIEALREQGRQQIRQADAEDKAAKDAAARSKAEGDRQRAREAADEAAKKAAAKAAQELEAAKRLNEEKAKTLQQLDLQAKYAGNASVANTVDLEVEKLRLQYKKQWTAEDEKRARADYQAIEDAKALDEAQKRALEARKKSITDLAEAEQAYFSGVEGDIEKLLSGQKTGSLAKQLGDAVRREMASAITTTLTGFRGEASGSKGLLAFITGGAADLQKLREKALGENTEGLTLTRAKLDELIQTIDDQKNGVGKGGAATTVKAASTIGKGDFGTLLKSDGTYSNPAIDQVTELLDPGAVTVTGKRKPQGFRVIAESEIERQIGGAKDLAKSVVNGLFGKNNKIGEAGSKVSETFQSISNVAGKLFGGASIGATSTALLGGLGLKTSALGGQLGGALGSLIPIPGASFVTGAIGGLVGGALKSVKQGSTSISLGSNGQFGAGSASGNDSASKKAASGLAGSIDQQLNSIVSALGAKFADVPNITIGQRHGDYRVNLAGSSLKVKGGAQDFNDDADGAVAFAVKSILEKSTISGISQAAINILKSGQDLSAALQKATDIESIGTRLKAFTDPLGAEIDDIHKQFKSLFDELTEGGATLQQFADAQALQQKTIEQATQQTLGSLKSFRDSLDVGPNSALSYRDQETNALAKFSSFESDVNAGKAVNASDFQSAAESLLGIEKQINGSSETFQQVFDRVKATSDRAITNASSSANSSAGDPFASRTATAVETTAANTADVAVSASNTVSAIDDLRPLLEQIAANTNTSQSYSSPFISGGSGGWAIFSDSRFSAV